MSVKGGGCQVLLDYPTEFLPVTLASQRRFQTMLLSGWNVEGMTLNFANDVFLLYLAFETSQRAFEGFVIPKANLCQNIFTCLSTLQVK